MLVQLVLLEMLAVVPLQLLMEMILFLLVQMLVLGSLVLLGIMPLQLFI